MHALSCTNLHVVLCQVQDGQRAGAGSIRLRGARHHVLTPGRNIVLPPPPMLTLERTT